MFPNFECLELSFEGLDTRLEPRSSKLWKIEVRGTVNLPLSGTIHIMNEANNETYYIAGNTLGQEEAAHVYSDWPPERARRAHLTCLGLPT